MIVFRPLLASTLLVALLTLPGPASAAGWKYKYLAVVIQNSGAHRANGLSLIELLNRVAAIKPRGVTIAMLGFSKEFKQLDEGRFARRTAQLLGDTANSAEMREAVAELVFHGPSPVFDAVGEALDAAARNPDGAVLLVSNGVDNASDVSFDDLTRRAEKAAVPIFAFYYPTNPPLNGDSRMRKLAKVSGGRYIDVRLKDCWEQLVAALSAAQ